MMGSCYSPCYCIHTHDDCLLGLFFFTIHNKPRAMDGQGEVPGLKEKGCRTETQSTASVDDHVDDHVDEVNRSLFFFLLLLFT